MTREYLRLEKEGRSFEELEQLTLGGLRRAVQDGDVIQGYVMSGQSAGLVREILSCREVIEQITRQAQALLKGRSDE